jgi:hypothetical protein
MTLPLCGVLEMEHGRVKAWRDDDDGTPFAET